MTSLAQSLKRTLSTLRLPRLPASAVQSRLAHLIEATHSTVRGREEVIAKLDFLEAKVRELQEQIDTMTLKLASLEHRIHDLDKK